jgi:hypothetical protein
VTGSCHLGGRSREGEALVGREGEALVYPPQPCTFPAHVLGLAQSIYAAFPAVSEDYAVLADALEELGEAEAAAHCRQELHAKGCSVVDWITGGK